MPGDRVPLRFQWTKATAGDMSLTAADKHVALQLAEHMDLDGGSCYPGIRRLARECSRKAHTVIASIERLEQAGYLTVRRAAKRNEHGWSADVNQYTAQLPEGTTAPVARRGASQLSQGTTKHSKSNGVGRKNAPAVCEHCDVDVRHHPHAADCELA